MDKKIERIINMYNRVVEGELIVKADEAARFGVNERSIQRDIEDIRSFFANDPDSDRELIYDRAKKGYMLVQNSKKTLTNSEILAVCKILLESRSLTKDEMYPIIDKLIMRCVPYANYKKVAKLIANEKHHYLEPHHQKRFVEDMWNIASAVYERRLMRMRYRKLKEPEKVTRLVQPVGIMFSEYYFYLCAYICAGEDTPDVPKHPFPTIYRIDRIAEYELTDIHFNEPYADRFQEGEFRKRIQFMFGGELRTICFKYKGISIESVLDRFPTAEVVSHDKSGWIIKAEVYGDGVDIWLRGQGDVIEVIDAGKSEEKTSRQADAPARVKQERATPSCAVKRKVRAAEKRKDDKDGKRAK
ncbi:MAG: WYL domain-containing protein [Clostridia bacterium]|nr:WYL domain-containing protein [Clostridia bacterium]